MINLSNVVTVSWILLKDRRKKRGEFSGKLLGWEEGGRGEIVKWVYCWINLRVW